MFGQKGAYHYPQVLVVSLLIVGGRIEEKFDIRKGNPSVQNQRPVSSDHRCLTKLSELSLLH